jgi:hypothetical protein
MPYPDFDSPEWAVMAAEFTGSFLIHRQRGVFRCEDRLVLFGNDGYSDDICSRREVEILLEKLANHQPVLGINEDGYAWAIVLTDNGFDEDELRDIVWDAWMIACDEATE